MELLEGLDLESLVKRFGALPPERAVHLLTQACESLAEAHAEGLIHRDVKPATMITCHWGRKWDFVKVLDFGLVKTTWNLGEDDRLTTDGLGCVAYWLLTGRRVFTGHTPMEVVLHHVKTEPEPPSRRVAWPIPESLEGLVRPSPSPGWPRWQRGPPPREGAVALSPKRGERGAGRLTSRAVRLIVGRFPNKVGPASRRPGYARRFRPTLLRVTGHPPGRRLLETGG